MACECVNNYSIHSWFHATIVMERKKSQMRTQINQKLEESGERERYTVLIKHYLIKKVFEDILQSFLD